MIQPLVTHEQYQILQEIDINTDGALSEMLNEWEMPEYTVCPACSLDDFTHEEGCKEECNMTDEDYDDDYCTTCSGSGEGQHCGTRCSACKGKGVKTNDDEAAIERAEYERDQER